MRNLAQRVAPDADTCEGAGLAHQNPEIERRLRRLCRIGVLADHYIAGLRRLAAERTGYRPQPQQELLR
jgi:hypothetical protein